MEKRLTVDLPEETHKELLVLQLKDFIASGEKKSLSLIIKEMIISSLEQKKATQD